MKLDIAITTTFHFLRRIRIIKLFPVSTIPMKVIKTEELVSSGGAKHL